MMDRTNQTLPNNSITYSETKTFVIVRKVKLAPLSLKKTLASHVVRESDELLTSRLSKSVPVCSRKFNSKSKLPPIISEKTPTMSMTFKRNEALTTRSNMIIGADNRIVKGQQKLPLISAFCSKKKVSFAEPSTSFAIVSNDIEQTPLSFESTVETSSDSEQPTMRSQVHFFHPFKLVWLQSNEQKPGVDYEHSINQLRRVIHEVFVFKNSQSCVDFFLTNIDKPIFLILSNDFDQSLLFKIHHLSQLDAIYIFSDTIPKNKKCTKMWTKIRGMFKDIGEICENLKLETQRCRRDSNAISITSVNSNRLDSSFMYTQLIKEIILEMEDDDKAKKELIQFCRKNNKGKSNRIKIIDEFEQHYHIHTPVWWYTRGCFFYDMINQALRLQEINVIIQTRFFIRDLYRQIEQLYEPPTDEFTLYRGQGLSYGDFEQLCSMNGGLYSFHQFLSTSTDRDVALGFALSSRDNPDTIGIVFRININPVSLNSALFASLKEKSYFFKEKETLFNMHTVFRVGEMIPLEHDLWEVELSLTSDDDKDLKKVTDNIRQATHRSTGWDRLGELLLRMGKFDKAEEVYEILIENSSEDDSKGLAHRYRLMASVKENKNDYKEALIFLNKALEIYQSLPDSNRLDFATLYNEIGSIHQNLKQYPKALEFHRMALDIQKETDPPNHSDLVITYGNLAEVYKHMKHHLEALQFYQKKLNIHKKSVPFNYLTLAITYGNIAEMYYQMGKYSEALKLFRKVSNIRQHRLARNNTEIAISYNNIAKVYELMEDYLSAIVYHRYAHDILAKSLPVNFSELAMTCNKIARTYKEIKQPSEALKYYRETLRNLNKSSHLEDIHVAATYDNIGQMYEHIGEYTKAFYSYRQAIHFEQQLLARHNSQLHLYQKHLAEVQKVIMTFEFHK